MLLLPLYAIFVWYCCLKWRRQLQGLIALVLGEALVLTLVYLEHRFRIGGDREAGSFSNLELLLAGEALMVAAFGLFFWILPRHRAALPCRKCGYELEGLEDANPTCPECGVVSAVKRVNG